MLVIVVVGKKLLQVLIDPGNTNKFLDEGTTQGLGCMIQKMKPLKVTVANGAVLICNQAWRTQG